MAKAVMEAFPELPLMSFGTSKKEMANARTKFGLGLLSGSGLLDVFLISLYEVVRFVMVKCNNTHSSKLQPLKANVHCTDIQVL